MPSAAPLIGQQAQQLLTALGAQLRVARRQQRVPAVAAAEAAGMSRMTLHRIERGEASVAAGAWVAVALALGLQLQLTTPGAAAANAPTRSALPDRIRLADYPQLRQLAWQLQGKDEVSPKEALDLYERNWRHIDRSQLTMHEIALIGALASTVGGGRLLV